MHACKRERECASKCVRVILSLYPLISRKCSQHGRTIAPSFCFCFSRPPSQPSPFLFLFARAQNNTPENRVYAARRPQHTGGTNTGSRCFILCVGHHPQCTHKSRLLHTRCSSRRVDVPTRAIQVPQVIEVIDPVTLKSRVPELPETPKS